MSQLDFTQLDWAQLFKWFPDLKKLDGCQQDPIWHAEGDVLTHTKMVIDALTTNPAWQQADTETQSILGWAALLHDIAKPLTTILQDGRIRSPRHALKGASMVQNLLYEQFPLELEPMPLDHRLKIIALVRYHGLPLWFWDKDEVQHTVIRASHDVRCDWIALLSESDVRGRIADDQQDLLERVTLFRDYCAENQCLTQVYPFHSAMSRFQYLQDPSKHPTYQAYDDSACHVIMMSGLPGAGKDTWIAEHAAQLPIISLDAIRDELGIKPTDNQSPVIIQAKERAREHLRQGQDFVWNATNLTRRLRAPLIDLFIGYKARVTVVYLETPWQTSLKRNQAREDSVPVDVLHKMASLLDVPSISEAHEIIWQTSD